MKKAPFLVLAFALLLFLPFTRTYAQTAAAAEQTAAAPDQLFKTVQSLDTQLFDAYNHCDLATLGAMVSEDLEFYHDKTGLAVGRQVFVDAIKNNICGKVTRELVPGALEVYPIADYGAVEIGVHTFHHPGEPSSVGEAKFIILWHQKEGKWQVTRTISFDHHPAAAK